MFVIENCFRLVLTEAAIYLRNPGVDPRVKRLLKRELSSELVRLVLTEAMSN